MSPDPRIEHYIKALEQHLESNQAALPMATELADPLDRLGTAIEQFSAQMKNREQEIQRLFSITAKVSAGLTLEEMMEYIYDTFRDVIPYHRMGLALLEQNGEVLRAHWAKSDQPILRLEVDYNAHMAGSSLQTILDSGRPRILNDLKEYLEQKPGSESTQLIVEEGYRSSLTCPLIVEGQPVGFLFFSSRETAAYDGTHIDTFVQIADQLSILVEKGRLVSELSDQKRELETINQELQNNDEARRAILAIAAHDLRAPLSYIKTSTDVLLEAKGDELAAETPEIIAGISRQAQHLLSLLDRLLDYSMIETGQMGLSLVAVDIGKWITEIVARQRSVAQTKNIQIELLPPPPGKFMIDPLRMGQVMANYMSNALKFSSAGSRVRVEVSKEINCWRISVHDQGPGIQPDERERLFRPFQTRPCPTDRGGKEHRAGLMDSRLDSSGAWRRGWGHIQPE